MSPKRFIFYFGIKLYKLNFIILNGGVEHFLNAINIGIEYYLPDNL